MPRTGRGVGNGDDCSAAVGGECGRVGGVKGDFIIQNPPNAVITVWNINLRVTSGQNNKHNMAEFSSDPTHSALSTRRTEIDAPSFFFFGKKNKNNLHKVRAKKMMQNNHFLHWNGRRSRTLQMFFYLQTDIYFLSRYTYEFVSMCVSVYAYIF